MKRTTDTHRTLPMDQGGQIRLIRLAGETRYRPPLILAHGTLSNASTVQDLGRYLAQQGHDTWLLEWGGHGASKARSNRQNFEAPARHDLPFALDFVTQTTGSDKVAWVGHSGGGLLPLMFLGQQPERQDRFACLVTLGAQATAFAADRSLRFQALALYLLTRVMGRTPRLTPAMGDEGEPTTLLAQWALWNLREKWTGQDGMDYLKAISQIRIPCLSMAGTRDIIAPVPGCRTVFDGLGGPDKTFVVCGLETGFSRDFSHAALIRGEAAHAEVFPRIHSWLEDRLPAT